MRDLSFVMGAFPSEGSSLGQTGMAVLHAPLGNVAVHSCGVVMRIHMSMPFLNEEPAAFGGSSLLLPVPNALLIPKYRNPYTKKA
jgi:hypothetical protein